MLKWFLPYVTQLCLINGHNYHNNPKILDPFCPIWQRLLIPVLTYILVPNPSLYVLCNLVPINFKYICMPTYVGIALCDACECVKGMRDDSGGAGRPAARLWYNLKITRDGREPRGSRHPSGLLKKHNPHYISRVDYVKHYLYWIFFRVSIFIVSIEAKCIFF